MSRVRSKDSKIEVDFRKAVWKAGFRYRKNPTKYFGKPDLALKKRKTVIFIDSCFWHGCKKHCRMPSSNRNYWNRKIAGNMKRDKEVNRCYKDRGWVCLRFWEHELKDDKGVLKALKRLEKAAKSA